jgi:signal transduction histidine kinase
MKYSPFRFKIAVLVAAVSGIVLAGAGAGAWYLLYTQHLELVDTEIRALGSRHPGWLANRSNFDRFFASLQSIFGQSHQGGIILMVKDSLGGVLYQSPNWPGGIRADALDCALEAGREAGIAEQGLGRGPGGGGRGLGGGRGGGPVVLDRRPRFLTLRTGEDTWRLGIMGNDDLRLVVGQSFNVVQAQLRQIRNIFLGIFPVALTAVGAGGWWVAGRAMRPLRRVSRTAEQVSARGLEQRMPISHEDPEILRLTQVLNGMMDRLEASFRQATRFSADASHELKTPLTLMQGELELAIQKARPDSQEQPVLVGLLEQTQLLKGIISRLLLLAQADSGHLKLALEEVNLGEEVASMVEDARAMGEVERIQLSLDLQPGIRILADRGLLRIAVQNLLRNAIQYNVPDGSVEVKLAAEPKVALTVCNSGPGIAAVDQPRVFERFYRGENPALEGHRGQGLGLSLAREIASAHGGSLVLSESRPGRTCFVLALKDGGELEMPAR